MISRIVIVGALVAAGAASCAERPVSDLDASQGKKIYLRECAACHGDKGNGKGPAAAFLDPKPRDFTRKIFKFRTTPSGQPPRTEDLLKTVEHGLPGSSMPPFGFLTAGERKKVVAYVLALADLIDSPEPEPIAGAGPQPPSTPASVAKGKEVYSKMGCFKCHGETGKGDGVAAADLKDDQERPIKVRDFTSGVFRGGSTAGDLMTRLSTGLDGSPMPAFVDVIPAPDRWALIDYVMSLKQPVVEAPLPADAIAAGHQIADKYGCRGCHVLEDGKGGEVGPDLRISGRKLQPRWVRQFLKDPRAAGKIYPWREHRMPGLQLSAAEVDALVKYLAVVGQRPADLPDEGPKIALHEKPDDDGKNFFVLRCSQCHALGEIVKTPLASQQGPDLINVARRVDFDWAKTWISDPKKVDPKTRMTVTDITKEQIEKVRDFVFRSSVGAGIMGSSGGGPSGGGK